MGPEGNIELYLLLRNWNPLKLDFDFDAEIYDSMDVLYRCRETETAAREIQGIFFYSFEEKIDMDHIRPVVAEAFKIIELYKEP